MLNMDIETLQAALLFPLADADVVTEDVLRESVASPSWRLSTACVIWLPFVSLKPRKRTLSTSEQVDNVRRMLLAMVDDFRCVVIKLAERVAHLREVKDAPEDERVLAAKECTSIYAPLANRLGIGQLKWELEITASAICIRRNTNALQNCCTNAALTASTISRNLSAGCASR